MSEEYKQKCPNCSTIIKSNVKLEKGFRCYECWEAAGNNECKYYNKNE